MTVVARRPRLLHIINNLAAGGAESMLVRLALSLRERFEQQVICILDRGPLADDLVRQGVPVVALGASIARPNPLVLLPLIAAVRRYRPDVVQTWLYQADLLGGIAARIAGVRAVAWNVRGADISAREAHPATRWALRLNAPLSRVLPTRIVYCARSAQRVHHALGYMAAKGVCIPNGVDLARFRPDGPARLRVRRELGVADSTPLLGLVARWNPQKDHRTFFRAADKLMRRWPDLRIVFAGVGMELSNAAVASLIATLPDPARALLLGVRRDTPAVTAALDLAASSSSWGEGFPNVVAEAMACGVPAVATDAGDAAEIIGDTGRIVPRRDPDALAAACDELLCLAPAQRVALGDRARARIESRFSLAHAVERYADLYFEMAEMR